LKPAVDDQGLLQIDWPSLAGSAAELDGFDLLLATATAPVPHLNDAGHHDPAIIAAAPIPSRPHTSTLIESMELQRFKMNRFTGC
jgi:hypothetical protein